MSDPKPLRQYTNDEAASIIARVLDRQNGEGGRISHDELLETARDIGVTTLELEEAVVAETRARAERIVRDEEHQRELRRLLPHVITYVIAVAFCAVIDLRMTSGVWWYWVALGWGVVVTLHTLKVFLPTEADRRLAAHEAGKKSVEARDGKLTLKSPPGA